MIATPARQRVIAFLEDQEEFLHQGAIARGAGVSQTTVRNTLHALDVEHRIEVRRWMPGPTGPGYRLVRAGRLPGGADGSNPSRD